MITRAELDRLRERRRLEQLARERAWLAQLRSDLRAGRAPSVPPAPGAVRFLPRAQA